MAQNCLQTFQFSHLQCLLYCMKISRSNSKNREIKMHQKICFNLLSVFIVKNEWKIHQFVLFSFFI